MIKDIVHALASNMLLYNNIKSKYKIKSGPLEFTHLTFWAPNQHQMWTSLSAQPCTLGKMWNEKS